MTDWHPGNPDRRRTGDTMDDGFQGYVRAKLEDFGRVQAEQRAEIQEIRADIASLRVAVGALKATARAWGIFAGILSGALSSVAGKLWRP